MHPVSRTSLATQPLEAGIDRAYLLGAGIDRASFLGLGIEPEPKVRGRAEADLGQKEAELEQASEEELRHMEGGKAAEAAVEKKRNI